MSKYVTAKNAGEKYLYQLYRRVQKWWALDPEYSDHMPENQAQYRLPSPSSQPSAKVPRQQFMKEFHIKYYKRDYRLGGEADKEQQNQFKIIWRDEIIESPIRLQRGETMGPFYGFGLEKRVFMAYNEFLNKQVYSYTKNKYQFKPEECPEEDLTDYYTEEKSQQEAKKK